MSHLPHVFAFKDKLMAEGITCPVELTNLVSEPFATAIISYHFKFSNVLGLTEHQEGKIWNKLDDWNKVSPINAPLVMAIVNERISSLRVQLANTGKPCMIPFTKTFSNKEGVPVDINASEEFKILVSYLIEEMVNCHE